MTDTLEKSLIEIFGEEEEVTNELNEDMYSEILEEKEEKPKVIKKVKFNENNSPDIVCKLTKDKEYDLLGVDFIPVYNNPFGAGDLLQYKLKDDNDKIIKVPYFLFYK